MRPTLHLERATPDGPLELVARDPLTGAELDRRVPTGRQIARIRAAERRSRDRFIIGAEKPGP